jgi:hypothetical protein
MFEIRGLDEAMRQLKRLEDNTRALSGRHDIRSSDLFPPAFMRQYTKVASFEALLEASGLKVESQIDFEAIPDAEWEKAIQAHTSFSSWREMQEKAGVEYAERKLMEGA